MPQVWVLQHAEPENLGSISRALEREGISAHYVKTFEGQPVPDDMGPAGGLILMGGPMGVYDVDRYPFLLDEMKLIERALRQDKPVLGVCLGSQLLASALGARVRKGAQKEIGWHAVALTESASGDPLWRGVPASFIAYHWHGDVFDLPAGAVGLASSERTECQAYRHGRGAYGLLFHAEVTGNIIREMAQAFSDELLEAGISIEHILQGARDHLPGLERIGEAVFGRWAKLIGSRRP